MTIKTTQPPNTQTIGYLAENIACEYLQQQGLHLIERNFHCRLGEIDLIMRDKTTLIFVEVRWRRHSAFGTSSESVTYLKQRKLLRTARFYLQKHQLTEKMACRFDVVGITQHLPNPHIEWIKDAFSA